MKEFEFIRAIKQTSYAQPSLIKGIGDDAAVFRQNTEDIVTAVDTFVEGVHFTRETMDPYHVGYRALAANVSDMAAMGAMPVMCLVSVAVPATWKAEERLAVMDGIQAMAKPYHIDIIGGDTVSSDTFVLSITIIGYVDRQKVRYRSTAKAGDLVFVTGTLGDSAAGLSILLEEVNMQNNRSYYIKRHHLPEPRVDFTQALATVDRVTLNDVSDGIASELHEIAEASNVSIYVRDKTIPVSSHYHTFPEELQSHWKYFGGEDFEIVGTVAPHLWEGVQRAAAHTDTRITAIGYVTVGEGLVYVERDEMYSLLPKDGYEHTK